MFNKNLADAAEIQRTLANQVCTEDDLPIIQTLAGLDVSCNFRDPEKMVFGAAVTLNSTTLQMQEKSLIAMRQEFPYVSGFLAFREAPVLIAALKGLKALPDLLMVDGHGICHPRGLGIASHLGVLLNLPSIGVGKTVLVGEPLQPLGPKAGDRVPLIYKKKEVAMLLRTKERAHPLVISIGHRISLKTAVEWVWRTLSRYRLPETTRLAHLGANEARVKTSLRG